jgi:hypothetical protein
VPLPLHPLFFELVRGAPADPAALASPQGHMAGCAGETVARLMALLPTLTAARAAAAAAAEAAAAGRPELAASCATEAKRLLGRALDRPYPWTGGAALRALLAATPLEYADPITGLALSPPPPAAAAAVAAASSAAGWAGVWDGELEALLRPGAGEAAVSPGGLLGFLEAVAELWLGSGVARQVDAFKQGVSQVFAWRHLLAFSAAELSAMMCGAGDVQWTDKALRRVLKPASGFDADCATMKWLRQELLAFTAPQRRSFLKFATAVPRLVPGLVLTVACKGSGGSWLPTAQTCTPQLNLAVYGRRRDLGAALREAMANADADGGFHERTAGSDGRSDGADRRASRQSAARAVLPPSMRGGGGGEQAGGGGEQAGGKAGASGGGSSGGSDGGVFGGGAASSRTEMREDEDEEEEEEDEAEVDEDEEEEGPGYGFYEAERARHRQEMEEVIFSGAMDDEDDDEEDEDEDGDGDAGDDPLFMRPTPEQAAAAAMQDMEQAMYSGESGNHGNEVSNFEERMMIEAAMASERWRSLPDDDEDL